MINNAYTAQDGMAKPMAAALIVGLVAMCGYITWSLSSQLDQTVLALILAFVLVQIALVAPRSAICIVFVYLAVLGDVRRLMGYFVGVVRYDVLLLVGPIVAIVMMSICVLRGELNARDKLSWWICILTLLMILQMFNPEQASLAVGFGGALFYLVPISWYWIGQRYGSQQFLHTVLYQVVVPVAIAASIFGLWQISIGVPDYQYQWLLIQSNVAVTIGGLVRPFAFFVSPPEFALYCSATSTILLSGVVIKKLHPMMLFAPVMMVCCFLQSSRGIMLGNIIGLVGIWGLRRRAGETKVSLSRLFVLGIAIIGSFIALVTVLANTSGLDARFQPMIQHQTQGLLDPMHSSASDHSVMFSNGITSSFTNPVGSGLGSTTLAAKLVTNGDATPTEVDISDMFVALGPVGGIIYLIVIFRVFQVILTNIRNSETNEGIAVLGMLLCSVGQWLNGGQYALATIIWFCIGAVHRIEIDRTEAIKLPVAAKAISPNRVSRKLRHGSFMPG